ncbi:hypothetical protein ACIBKZ_22660 [Streptomyces sp. NPDC050421]|uniref:hypothetical protein n=1 Tax=unclassified Streptomyces TaxID=2593676 RepID=UPI0037B96BB1
MNRAIDATPRPNQWIKDHLDGVIDAHFLPDCPAPVATAPPKPGKELRPTP